MGNEKKYVLKRGERVPVMMTPMEREEIQDAAQKAGMGLSVFLRVMALEAARRRVAKAA